MRREEKEPSAPELSHMSQDDIRLAAQAAMGNGAVRPGEGNIEKIRDILFGSHYQEINRQFARLEALVQQEMAGLREAFNRRCDDLERYFKTEVASLNNRLTAEQNTRADAIEKLVRETKELGDTFEKKLAQLAEQTAEGQHELRASWLEQSKGLAEDMQNRYADLSALLEQQLEGLRQAKTDRATLATLFGEMAARLSHEGEAPQLGGEESQET